MALRVGVFGAGGRMGATVCAAVAADPELELVAGVDPGRAGTPVPAGGGREIVLAPEADAMVAARVEVAVDFTAAEAARANAGWCAEHRIHDVIGTSGLTADDEAELHAAFAAAGAGCLLAPNFAIGAVLMMRFAELAAPWFETAEIIELHHDGKIDAPSGTAAATARRMAAASATWAPDPTTDETVPGARGGEGPAGIRVHAVRLRGLVASQEVLLGTTGQWLTIRHDSTDRASFMPGVLLAVKAVADRPGLTVGLDALLGV
jgi:4-hydroxy-tetrahydrodipicolinate reductase